MSFIRLAMPFRINCAPWVGSIGLVVTLACGPVHANVLEISDDGAVSVRPAIASIASIDGPLPADGMLATVIIPDLPAQAITSTPVPKVPDAWRASLLTAADRYAVSSDLLAALVWQESRWHASAVSPKGATGLTQLMPATARALAVDARDPVANLAGGAQYLRRMLDMFDGNIERALAAYNAGPSRVQRANGIPAIAETRSYVSNILLRLTPADAGQTGF